MKLQAQIDTAHTAKTKLQQRIHYLFKEKCCFLRPWSLSVRIKCVSLALHLLSLGVLSVRVLR